MFMAGAWVLIHYLEHSYNKPGRRPVSALPRCGFHIYKTRKQRPGGLSFVGNVF